MRYIILFALSSLFQHFFARARCHGPASLLLVPPPYPTVAIPVADDRSSLPPARVACIVVNWNNPGDTLACLAALELQSASDLAVFVVDNGSTDNSVAAIGEALRGRAVEAPGRMTLVEAGANLGFSAGNNVGIRAAARLQPEFVWLLNNDTVAPPETLAKLLAAADRRSDAGIVGSVLRYAHDPSRIQAWGGGHVTPSTAYATHFTAPRALGKDDYLTFASVLIRTALLRQVGLLDERFFMYYEDVEFCLRAQRAGWALAVAEDTAILHKEGSSSGGRRSSRLERAITVSGLMLIHLHGRYCVPGMLVYFAARLGNRVVHGRWREARDVLAGAWAFLTRVRA